MKDRKALIARLDFNLVIRRVKKDLRDDWFADPLHYKDALNIEAMRHHVSTHPDSIHGEAAEVFNLPKPRFTLRYSLETPILDRILYHDLPPENGSRPYVRIMWFLDLKGRSGYGEETAHGGADHREAA